MRRALVLVLLLAIMSQAGASQHHLAAALAPVQTAVDGASQVVLLALPEATRDGTPDDAWAMQGHLDTFVSQLSNEWQLPENATYRDEGVAALPYAVTVAAAVARVPDEAGAVARIIGTCEGRMLSEDEAREVRMGIQRLLLDADHLDTLALDAPSGVRGAPLADAASAIRAWVTSDSEPSQCGVILDDAAPLLRFELYPPRTWPSATVRLVGLTNLAGPVAVDVPSLGISFTLTPSGGRFHHTFVVPHDAPLAEATVRATVGSLVAERVLLVEKAPSQLRIDGPPRVASGSDVTLRLRLTSPLFHVTDHATVHATVPVERAVSLVDGRGALSLRMPDEPLRVRVHVHYPGTDVVASADAEFVIDVVDPARLALPDEQVAKSPALAAEQPAEQAAKPRLMPAFDGGTFDTLPAGLLTFLSAMPVFAWWLILLVLIVVGAYVLWARRRRASRGAGTPLVTTRPTSVRLATLTAGASWTVVQAFVGLVRLLRAQGIVSASSTAREAGARLKAMGIDASGIVATFERARYGNEPEEAGWWARTSAWFEDARRRLQEKDA